MVSCFDLASVLKVHYLATLSVYEQVTRSTSEGEVDCLWAPPPDLHAEALTLQYGCTWRGASKVVVL